MALIFMDGFDHYVQADLLKKYTTTSTMGINATAGRRGTGALWVTSNNWISKSFQTTYSTLITGFAYNPYAGLGGGYEMIQMWEGSNRQVFVYPNSDGSMSIYKWNGGSSILLGKTPVGSMQGGAYNYLEFKMVFHPTTGSVQVRINGETVLNLTNVATRNTASTVNGANTVYWGPGGPNVYIDDLYLCDDSGTTNNDFLGDVRVDTLLPNSEGTYAQFTPSTGTVHYSLVSEAAPNTTNYVTSSMVGAKDSFNFADLVQLTGNIKGVQINNTSWKDDAGTRSVGNIVKSGATEVQVGEKFLSTSQSTLSTIVELDPATGLPWTANAVNNAEFGTIVKS